MKQNNFFASFNHKLNRIIAIVFLLSIALSLSAQRNGKIENKKYQFCVVDFKDSSTGKTRIEIQCGFAEKVIPEDESKNQIWFNNRAAVINYMTLQGWEYLGWSMDLTGYEKPMFKRQVSDDEANELIDQLKYNKR